MTAEVSQQPHAAGPLRAYLLLAFTALCWGGNANFGRLAVGEISPMLLVSLRWFGVLVLLGLLAHRQVRRDWPVLRTRLGFVAAMGVFGYTVFNGMFYVAAHSTTAINMGILQGAMPMFVLVGAFAAYRTPVTPLQGVGVAVTLLGVVIVAAGGNLARLAALAINFGDLLMIAACALYAGYTVALRQRPAISALALFTGMAAAAFAAALPLVAVEAALGWFQWPTAKGWLVAGLVTLFPSFLAQLAFMKGVEAIGPGRAGVFVNLVPVFAAILAVVVLGESFAGFHGLALALVLGGIWLSERGKAG